MSGSRYRPFDYATFAGWMQEIGFTETALPGTWEYVWQRPVTCRLSNGRYAVRIYSSVSKLNGVSRESGGDAIRVILMDTTRDKPVLNYQVNRTENAHSNAVKRAREAYGYVSQDANHHCTCGGLMVVRKGANGQFWGCSSYPDCKKTRPFSH